LLQSISLIEGQSILKRTVSQLKRRPFLRLPASPYPKGRQNVMIEII
jgi:hypothetical protein